VLQDQRLKQEELVQLDITVLQALQGKRTVPQACTVLEQETLNQLVTAVLDTFVSLELPHPVLLMV